MTTKPTDAPAEPQPAQRGIPQNPTAENDWMAWVACNDTFHADAPNQKGASR